MVSIEASGYYTSRDGKNTTRLPDIGRATPNRHRGMDHSDTTPHLMGKKGNLSSIKKIPGARKFKKGDGRSVLLNQDESAES